MKIKLSQWAKNHGVCYATAWNKYKSGGFPGSEVNDKGSIFVDDEPSLKEMLLRERKRSNDFYEKALAVLEGKGGE